MVSGLVLHPATLVTTGRLKSKISDRANEVVEAYLRVLKAKKRRARIFSTKARR
jgi:hypothetical protein